MIFRQARSREGKEETPLEEETLQEQNVKRNKTMYPCDTESAQRGVFQAKFSLASPSTFQVPLLCNLLSESLQAPSCVVVRSLLAYDTHYCVFLTKQNGNCLCSTTATGCARECHTKIVFTFLSCTRGVSEIGPKHAFSVGDTQARKEHCTERARLHYAVKRGARRKCMPAQKTRQGDYMWWT